MDAVKAFFESLEALLHEAELETTHMEGIGETQLGDTLRILLPVNEDGDPVIMEIMLLRYSDDRNLLYFYATIAVDVTDEGRAQLLEAIQEWNMHCSMGAYGLYEEGGERQLYHKYSILCARDADGENLSETAAEYLANLQDVIGEQLPVIKTLLGAEDESA